LATKGETVANKGLSWRLEIVRSNQMGSDTRIENSERHEMTTNTCKVEQGTTDSLFSAIIASMFSSDNADLAEIKNKSCIIFLEGSV